MYISLSYSIKAVINKQKKHMYTVLFIIINNNNNN